MLDAFLLDNKEDYTFDQSMRPALVKLNKNAPTPQQEIDDRQQRIKNKPARVLP